MPGKNKIPDGWEDYTPVGEPIDGTRFIAFRVPLHMGLCRRVAEEQRFTPTDLIETVEKKGFKLGLIIDLTFTTRYYNKEEFLSRDIRYEKVFTAGHVVPNKSVRIKFFSVVDSFLEENKDNDLLIGVHCTHGLNRTGYLICRYLIDNMKFSPDEAVIKFDKARGHKIERENYLEDLKMGVSTHELPDEEEPISPEKANPFSIEDHSESRGSYNQYNEHYSTERSDRHQRHDRDSNYRNTSSRWQERSYSNPDDRIPNHRWPNEGYSRQNSSSSWPRHNPRRYQDRNSSGYRHESRSDGYQRKSNYERREDYYGNYSSADGYGQFGYQHAHGSNRADRNSDYVDHSRHYPSRRNERSSYNSRHGDSTYHDRDSIRGSNS